MGLRRWDLRQVLAPLRPVCSLRVARLKTRAGYRTKKEKELVKQLEGWTGYHPKKKL